MPLFWCRVVLWAAHNPPLPSLKPPLVLLSSADLPTAVLLSPVLIGSALVPSEVLPVPKSHSPEQGAALTGGESANQVSAIASVKKPQRKGERLIDLISVFIFSLFGLKLPC